VTRSDDDDNETTSWAKMFDEVRASVGDSSAIVERACSDEDWVAEFNDGYGATEGAPFTVWTEERVYFPICYDGSEWIGSAARNPNGKPTDHQGSG
jgi:hypothetical protein